MNEFETQVLSLLQGMDKRLTSMENRITSLEDRMTKMESDLKSFKAETNKNFNKVFGDLRVIRSSANDTGIKLEKLVNELRDEEVISKEVYSNIMSNA